MVSLLYLFGFFALGLEMVYREIPRGTFIVLVISSCIFFLEKCDTPSMQRASTDNASLSFLKLRSAV